MKKKLIKFAVILLCLVANFLFVQEKEGYHMDEIMSFELANAEYNPWIVPCQPVGRLAKFVHTEIDGDSFKESASNFVGVIEDVLANGPESKLLTYTADVYEEPQWISGEEFKDYVTVDSSDDFNYFSVYFNVKDDNHPFLHFALLHTVSSIFKGQMTPLMGCSVNLIFLGLSLWLLMGIVEILFGNKKYTLLAETAAAVFYGFSSGTVATTLLIRMYGMVTFFVVALLYIHLKKYKYGVQPKKWGLLLLVTVCGFLTQYFFLFYCLPLALVFTIVLLAEKRNKEAGRYIGTMASAGLVGVIIFPFAISDVFSSGRGVEAIDNLKSGFSGYGERLASFFNILATRTVGNMWILGTFMLFALVSLILCLRENKKRFGLAAILVFPAVSYFLLAARMSPYEVDRYIMPIFPIVSLGLILGVIIFAMKNPSPKWMKIVIVELFMIIPAMGVLNYDGEYLYTGYASEEAISEEYASDACVLVYDGYSFYENLPELMNYRTSLLTKETELYNRTDLSGFDSENQLVVYIKRLVDADSVLSYFNSLGFTDAELLLDASASPYGDSIYLLTK